MPWKLLTFGLPGHLISSELSRAFDPTTIDTLMSILESLPQLHHLVLDRSCRIEKGGTTSIGRPPVILLALQTCRANLDVAEFCALYRSIHWSEITHLKAKITSQYSRSLKDFADICRSSSLAEALTSLVITSTHGMSIVTVLRGQKHELILDLVGMVTVKKFLAQVRVPSITDLSFSNPRGRIGCSKQGLIPSADSWIEFLQHHHPVISKVHLDGDVICEALSSLGKVSEEHGGVLPFLKELALSNTTIAAKGPTSSHSMITASGEDQRAVVAYQAFSALLNTLMNRKNAGRPIQRVLFRDDGVGEVMRRMDAASGEKCCYYEGRE